jgi:hypothetical protein
MNKNDGTQSRKNSFIEALTNVVIGYSIAFISQLLIFPMYGGNFTIEQNIYIGAWFTLISLVRSYVIRRWFTKKTERYPYEPMTYLEQHRNGPLTKKQRENFENNLLNINKKGE